MSNLLLIRDELQDKLDEVEGNVHQHAHGFGYVSAMKEAIDVVNEDIASTAEFVKEQLWHYDYDNMDWSKYTDDQLYRIHLDAEQGAYDGDEYCNKLQEAIPKPKQVEKSMSYELWRKTYKPLMNSDGTVLRIVANNNEMTELPKKYPNRVWTEVDGDGDYELVVNGITFVNRKSYIITKIPHKVGEIIKVNMESGNNAD